MVSIGDVRWCPREGRRREGDGGEAGVVEDETVAEHVRWVFGGIESPEKGRLDTGRSGTTARGGLARGDEDYGLVVGEDDDGVYDKVGKWGNGGGGPDGIGVGDGKKSLDEGLARGVAGGDEREKMEGGTAACRRRRVSAMEEGFGSDGTAASDDETGAPMVDGYGGRRWAVDEGVGVAVEGDGGGDDGLQRRRDRRRERKRRRASVDLGSGFVKQRMGHGRWRFGEDEASQVFSFKTKQQRGERDGGTVGL